MKNLESFGVQELNTNETKSTNGGDLGTTILAGIVIGAAVQVMNDWEHFKDGLFGK